MTHVVKLFDREKGLPFWYVEELDGSNRVGRRGARAFRARKPPDECGGSRNDADHEQGRARQARSPDTKP